MPVPRLIEKISFTNFDYVFVVWGGGSCMCTGGQVSEEVRDIGSPWKWSYKVTNHHYGYWELNLSLKEGKPASKVSRPYLLIFLRQHLL